MPSNAIFLGVKDGYRRYELPDTRAYLFGVITPEQRKNLLEKLDFLFRLLYSCGQQYSVRPIDVQSDGVLKKEIASTEEGFYYISQMLSTIANRLKNQDYVDERDLVRLYRFVNMAIYEDKKSKSSNDLIDQMYVPIKQWIKNNFPVSPMLHYIENSLKDLSFRASEVCRLSMDCVFKSDIYFNEYHSQTTEYKKITEWLDRSKADFVRAGDKERADRELKEFKREIAVPFDASRLPVGMDDIELFVEFIRYLESLHQKGEALLEKWCNFLDAAKQKRLEESQKASPEEALAAMMRALELEEECQPKKATPKGRSAGVPKAKPTPPTPASTPTAKTKETKAEVERRRLELVRERAMRDAEVADAKRLAQLEEVRRQNAERNAAAEQRVAELKARRDQERENRKLIISGLVRRQTSWIEALYEETQKLRMYDSSEHIDSAIFRGQPDFKEVTARLTAAGIYIKEHVHGNEKCVAMWKDPNNKNIIVWFDDPHGAQVVKGSSAGWVVSLRKALGESGRLRSE